MKLCFGVSTGYKRQTKLIMCQVNREIRRGRVMHSGIQHLPRKIKKEKGGEGKEEPFSIKRVPDGNVLVSKRVKSVK